MFLNRYVYLYVPGKLSNVNKVIVDVGTGYFVEKVTCCEYKRKLHVNNRELSISLSEMLPNFIMIKSAM